MNFLKKIKLVHLVILAFISFLVLYLLISLAEVFYLMFKKHNMETINIFKEWLTGLKKTITRLIDTFIGVGIGRQITKTSKKQKS